MTQRPPRTGLPLRLWLFPLGLIGLFLLLWWQVQLVPQQLRGWVQQLAHSTPKLRQEAFSHLKHAGERAAPYLLKGMEAGSRAKKLRLAQLLQNLGERGFPWVKKALRHRDWRIRELGLSILGQLPLPAPHKLPLLEHAFRDKNPYVRYTAVIELSRFGARASSLLPAMRSLLQEGTQPLPGYQTNQHTHDHDHQEPQAHVLSATDQAGGARHIARIIQGRLCGTADDVDREARLAIVRTLSLIETNAQKTARILLVSLQDRDKLIRQAARQQLLRLGPRIAPVLGAYLQRDKAPHRREVAALLGQMGPKVWPVLSPLLAPDTFPTTWFHAAFAVKSMGSNARSKLPQLCALWPTLSGRQQREIAEILAFMGHSSLRCIQQTLQLPAASLRSVAAYAAGRWAVHYLSTHPQPTGSPHSATPRTASPLLGLLERSLQAPEPAVWHEAAWALGEWRHLALPKLPALLALHSRCPALTNSLHPTSRPTSRWVRQDPDQDQDQDRRLSGGCASLLPRVWVKIGDQRREVVQALRSLLQQGGLDARRGSLLALLHASTLHPALHNDILRHLIAPETPLRRAAVEVLAHHAAILVRHTPTLQQILRDQALPVQLDTLWLLRRVGRRKDLAMRLWPQMQRNLQHSSIPRLRATLQVLRTLFPVDHKASIQAAISLLRYPHWTVQQQAVLLLSRHRSPTQEWISLVIKALDHQHWKVRKAAVQTLGVWGPAARQAERAVQARIQDSAYAVSMAAQFALLQIRGQKRSQPTSTRPAPIRR